MSQTDGSFSLDKMMKNMPKFFQLADDMHELTSYINDMRIMMIFLIVASALGGAVFLIIRHKKKTNKSPYRLTNKDDTTEEEIDGVEKGWTKSANVHHATNGHGHREKYEIKTETINGDRVMNL